MSLNTEAARPLTSREIAKILSSVLGGLAEWCEPLEIMRALRHFDEHEETYIRAFIKIHEKARNA